MHGLAMLGVARRGKARNKDMENKNQNQKENEMRPVFLGGVPTKPDVDRIIDAYPVEAMETGKIIPYEEIKNLLGDVTKSRFRTVTNAWRQQMFRTHGVIIDPSRKLAQAFEVLSEYGKTQKSQKETNGGTRKHIKAAIIISSVDTGKLTQEQKFEYDAITKRTAALIGAAQLKRPPILPAV